MHVCGFGFRATGDLRAFDRPSRGIGHYSPDIEKQQKKKKSCGHETFPLETFYKRFERRRTGLLTYGWPFFWLIFPLAQ
jgi:hypothetical protein